MDTILYLKNIAIVNLYYFAKLSEKIDNFTEFTSSHRQIVRLNNFFISSIDFFLKNVIIYLTLQYKAQ